MSVNAHYIYENRLVDHNVHIRKHIERLLEFSLS